MAALTKLDQLKAGLRARYPGWNIWYVPSAVGPPTWHAQPLPLLHASSHEDLASQIDEIERDRGTVSP